MFRLQVTVIRQTFQYMDMFNAYSMGTEEHTKVLKVIPLGPPCPVAGYLYFIYIKLSRDRPRWP